MAIYAFPPYGVSSSYHHINVILERVTWFTGISYNGDRGTEIHLDTGEIVRTALPEEKVVEIINGHLAK